MRADQIDELGDGIHCIGVNGDGRLEPTVDFAWDEIEPIAERDDSITWADASSLLVRVLQFVTAPDELKMAGARANLVVYLLDPSQCKYKSLRELGEACGCTKQALSRALMKWRLEVAVDLNLGKRAGSSESYRRAAYRSVEAGRHFTSARKRNGSES
jgi:hypothetical protein